VRILIIRKPDIPSIDGMQLDYFQPGAMYDVGASLASLMVVEGWAETVQGDEPAPVVPIFTSGFSWPQRVAAPREPGSRSVGDPRATAADRRKRRR